MSMKQIIRDETNKNWQYQQQVYKKLSYCLETARRESWTEVTFKCPSRSSKVLQIES